METKKCCIRCDREYPATEKYFSLDKRNKSGLGACCKKCASNAVATWRNGKGKNYNKKYRQENKEFFYRWQQNYTKTIRGYIARLVGAIKTRCNNPNHKKYKHYGGRNIKCLFNSKALFDWVVQNNIEPRNKHIHRVDNDGNYALDNIKFLTKDEHLKLHWEGRK